MAKNEAKKGKKTTKKKNKFHFGYYNTVFRSVVRTFEKIYKPVIDKEAIQNLEKPCLIFANHGSIFDFILAGAVLLPKKAVFVTTKRTMFNKGANWVVQKAPHILRDQFTADVKSILDMGDAIKQGYNVVLYAEGKVSTCGVTNRIPKATAKLVKIFKVPVVTIVSSGNWLLKPSWANHIRVGHVEVKTKQILTEEQIKTLDVEEIQEIIEKELEHNENTYQIENNYEFYDLLKKKNFGFSEGLEKILYKCPKCGKEFEMRTENDDIVCNECGFRATYHHNGLLTSDYENFNFTRIDEWYDFEKESLKEELKKEDFLISSNVELFVENEKDKKYDEIGKGVFTLDKKELRFHKEGIDDLVYKIDKVEGIPFAVGRKICLLINDINYEFQFKEKLMSTKYNMAIELLAEERNVKEKERSNKSR